MLLGLVDTIISTLTELLSPTWAPKETKFLSNWSLLSEQVDSFHPSLFSIYPIMFTTYTSGLVGLIWVDSSKNLLNQDAFGCYNIPTPCLSTVTNRFCFKSAEQGKELVEWRVSSPNLHGRTLHLLLPRQPFTRYQNRSCHPGLFRSPPCTT
jgi:hypothetical protein